MATAQIEKKNLVSYLFIIALVGIFGFWIKGIDIASGRQTAGVVIFYFGAVMLTAYVMSQVARKFNLPLLTGYLFAGHCSEEPGHRLTLDHLGLKPILDLGMRLGEGTGGALAMGIMDGAIRIFNDMATFEEAGVSGKEH